MSEEQKFTLPEPHRHFAVQLNGETWALLDKTERTPEEEERMLYAVFASGYHWLKAGTPLNWQRSEWLIARVYGVLGRVEEALRHARRCLELTEAYPDLMEDFDFAFAYEEMARALALTGQRDEAATYYERAAAAGTQIADAEDRQIFEADFHSGNWGALGR